MESLFVPLFFLAFPLALALLGGVLAWRAERPIRRRRILTGFAWTLIGIPTAFFVLMLVGYSIDDPGPAEALPMLGVWTLAAIAYLILAWVQPKLSVRLLAVLSAVPIGLGVWSAVDAGGFGGWLDQVGPVNLIVTYLLVLTGAVAAARRPREAGVVIVILAGVPAVLPLLVPSEALSRELIIAALNLPAVIAAVLLILAGTPAFTEHGPRADREPPPGRHERAAGREPSLQRAV
jgi:hypothetical protein